MKKIKLLLSALVVVAIAGFFNTASALQFDLNLNTIGAGYGNYTDIYRINVDGFADVNQSFGADHIFNSGDTFSETTILQQISYKNSINGSNKFFNALAAQGKYMYLYGENLTGKAINVTASNPMDLSTYKFDYTFDAGSGSIGIYIDTDTGTLAHNAMTAQLVASFSLVKGDGAGKDGFLGGLQNAGTTRLTGEFLAATPDNVWTAAGLDLGNLPAGYAAFAELNTTNQVVGGPFVYGTVAPDGFIAKINSTGHMTLGVVPEPATMILLGIGLIGLAGVSRKRIKE